MDPRLLGVASQQGGVFLTSQAADCGYSDDEIAARVKCRDWHRLRRGAYVTSDIWQAADEAARHLLLVWAVILSLKQPAVVSHTSAAAAHGYDLWDVDLSLVHVTRPELQCSRREASVVHHAGTLGDDEIEKLPSGLLVTKPPRSVVDMTRISSFASGLVTADMALRLGVKAVALLEVLERQRHWKGAAMASRVIEEADGRSESVGETLLRIAFMEIGAPRPEPQLQFFTEDGAEWARADFGFKKERVLAEFDGKRKYKVQPGADPEQAGEVVFREKRREEALRDLGWEIVRFIWADLHQRRLIASRLADAFARARRYLV